MKLSRKHPRHFKFKLLYFACLKDWNVWNDLFFIYWVFQAIFNIDRLVTTKKNESDMPSRGQLLVALATARQRNEEQKRSGGEFCVYWYDSIMKTKESKLIHPISTWSLMARALRLELQSVLIINWNCRTQQILMVIDLNLIYFHFDVIIVVEKIIRNSLLQSSSTSTWTVVVGRELAGKQSWYWSSEHTTCDGSARQRLLVHERVFGWPYNWRAR
jgi:hypothetical protein